MSVRLTINPRSDRDVARVREILEREFGLHWPQSPKLLALDLLAQDYAQDCRGLTLDEFQAACAAARAKAKYWPTPSAVLEASVALRAEARGTVTAADIVVTPPPTDEEIKTGREWVQRILELTAQARLN